MKVLFPFQKATKRENTDMLLRAQDARPGVASLPSFRLGASVAVAQETGALSWTSRWTRHAPEFPISHTRRAGERPADGSRDV